MDRKPGRKIIAKMIALCALLIAASVANFAALRLDDTFNPVLRKTDGLPQPVIIMPDGRVLAIVPTTENFSQPDPHYKLARLNSDGSFDRYYDNAVVDAASSLLLQPDGKIVIGNNTNGLATGVPILTRLNSDGSLDVSFQPPGMRTVYSLALQGAANILVGANFSPTPGDTRLVRLDLNGTLDPSFNSSGVYGFGELEVLPDNSFFTLSGGLITKYQPNGLPDDAFNNNRPNITVTYNVRDVALQPDGKLVIGGHGIARLNGNGSRDASFDAGTLFQDYQVNSVLLQNDGKILFGGMPLRMSGPQRTDERIFRLNSDGSRDLSFNTGDGFAVYQEDEIKAILLAPDGKIVVSGIFSYVNGQPRGGLVKLNSDGSVDSSLTYNTYFRAGQVKVILTQADGKILIGGKFDSVNGVSRSGIVRLNRDGSLDTSFDPGLVVRGEVGIIVVQNDGKLLVGGRFRVIGTGGKGLVRLNSDGSRDATLQSPQIETPEAYYLPFVSGIHPLSGGKLLVGGYFTDLDGLAGKNYLVRLLPDGTPDAAYDVTVVGYVTSEGPRFFSKSDGRVITSYLTLSQNGDQRINQLLDTSGNFDLSFDLARSTAAHPLAFLPDGKLLVAEPGPPGSFITYAYRHLDDGSQDPAFITSLVDRFTQWVTIAPNGETLYTVPNTFNYTSKIALFGPYGSANRVISGDFIGSAETTDLTSGPVSDIKFTFDNRLVAGGDFTKYKETPRVGLARFFVTSTPFDFDGDGRSDLSIFRPSSDQWWHLRSSDQDARVVEFGEAGDKLVPADYTGDGKTDVAVFHPATGQWFFQRSEDASTYSLYFGQNGDIPMPADYDGDGRADQAVFRPSNGVWYIFNSRDQTYTFIQFGANGDKPVAADYDGDLKADIAILRTAGANLQWWRVNSSNGQVVAHVFGLAGDKAVPGDYTGDGKTDVAVWRPSNGLWYILRSEDGNVFGYAFGLASDIAAPADFDGDGKFDAAIFRPSEGNWYINGSSSGLQIANFGTAGDAPIPSAFIP